MVIFECQDDKEFIRVKVMVVHHCEHAVILDESFLLKGVCEFKTPIIMPWCRILTNQWNADPHLYVSTVQMYDYRCVRCMYVNMYIYTDQIFHTSKIPFASLRCLCCKQGHSRNDAKRGSLETCRTV